MVDMLILRTLSNTQTLTSEMPQSSEDYCTARQKLKQIVEVTRSVREGIQKDAKKACVNGIQWSSVRDRMERCGG